MRKSRNAGFTLVEILIVVVILGILAAIVVPQFTNASQQAIKGALSSQLQTVSSQIELYRVQNAGTLPDADPTDPVGGTGSNGWGILVSGEYLKSEPMNGYTKTTTVVVAAAVPAFAAGGTGWAYSDGTVANTAGKVLAVGYDDVNNLISNETGYSAPAF